MYQVIIADDEAMECKVLEKMIADNLSSVQVLPSASNGMELLAQVEEHLPDIAIVDITMPGLNGLDAIEIICERHPQVKILVVSAYSKFEYAQKALSLGASDYLLKPVKEGEFLKAVQKLCREIDVESQREKEIQRSGEILKNYHDAVEHEFISEIILEDVTKKSLENYLGVLSHPFYGAFIISVQLLQGFQGDLTQIYLHFLQDMKKICTCLGRIKKNTLILCIFPSSYGSDNTQREAVIENLQCVLNHQPVGTSYSIGVSGYEHTVQELSLGIRESRLALLEQNTPGIRCWEASRPASGNSLFSYTQAKERCSLLVSQKQYSSFTEALISIASCEEKSGKSIHHLQIYFLDLMQMFFQMTPEIKSQHSYSMFITWIYWEKILNQSSFSELCKNIKWLIDQYLKNDDEDFPWSRHILSSLNYISKHYMEDLSLELVASQNKISSFYLSRLFKQELDHTFLELLTDIRISKAMELLFHGNYSVQEISQKCGYINTSYFYKLFKKQTGMTIGEMRNLIMIVH